MRSVQERKHILTIDDEILDTKTLQYLIWNTYCCKTWHYTLAVLISYLECVNPNSQLYLREFKNCTKYSTILPRHL